MPSESALHSDIDDHDGADVTIQYVLRLRAENMAHNRREQHLLREHTTAFLNGIDSPFHVHPDIFPSLCGERAGGRAGDSRAVCLDITQSIPRDRVVEVQ